MTRFSNLHLHRYGVVKVNLDTDMQWAYLSGIRDFVQSKSAYLQTQVGNPGKNYS